MGNATEHIVITPDNKKALREYAPTLSYNDSLGVLLKKVKETTK